MKLVTADQPLAKQTVAKSSESAAADRPSREEMQEPRSETMIRWAGDDADPARAWPGTPERVDRAPSMSSTSKATQVDPVVLLQRTFEEVAGYDEMVLLRDIRFESHCEHHMKPIIGRAHIAYLPDHRVVGHQQTGAGCRRLCQAPADPRKDDRADRQHHRRGAGAPRRRRW